MRDGPMRLTPNEAEPLDPLVGRIIAGKFAVEGRLGTGAMGIVYRARQLALERTVAIKVLHRELAANSEFADRFSREAKAASRLDHPNSIRVLDFGRETDGLLYLAMEYVEGCDLFDWVGQHGPLSVRSIVEILAQVLAALAVAHEMAVVHRDLKPENILIVRGVSDEGQTIDMVKVCDFGIAKILDAAVVVERAPRRKHSTGGLIVGTPAYMSPEQARGERQDARSDLYAVGVVLYELLTGRVPFDGDTLLAVALKHVSEVPEAPSALVPSVDPALQAICLKALQKKPGDRYQSAREMRLALYAAVGEAGARPSLPAGLLMRPEALHDSAKPTLIRRPNDAPPTGRGRALLMLLMPAACALLLFGIHSVTSRASPPVHLLPAATPSATPQPTAAAETAAVGEADETDAPGEQDSRPAPPAAHARAREIRAAHSAARTASREPPATVTTAGSPAPPPSPSPSSASPPSPSLSAFPSASLSLSASPAALQAPAPAYDLTTARVAVAAARNVVGATAASVTRAVSEAASRITACYRAALPQLSGTLEGTGLLHVDTDGAGTITDAQLSGPLHGAVASCVTAAVQGHRVANVDTGSASADVSLSFRAH